MKPHWYDLIVVCVVGIMVAWYGEIEPSAYAMHSELDLVQYQRMADAAPHIDPHVPAPFVYRILPPLLAGTLAPFVGSQVQAFRLLTIASLVGCLLLFRRWLLGRGIDARTSLFVTCLLAASPHVVGASLFNPYQLTDALSLLVIMASIMAVERGAWWRYAVLLCIGAATRETCMLMIPAAALVAWQQRLVRMALVASAPAIVIFFALRSMMLPENQGWDLIGNYDVYSWKLADPVAWYRLCVNCMIPFTLLPLIEPGRLPTLVRKNPHLAVLFVLVVVASFAGKDVERLVAPTFVGFYGLLAVRLHGRVRVDAITVVVLVVTVLLAALHPLYSQRGLVDRSTYIGISVLVSLTVPIFLALRTRRVF
ncbi:MAG: hypothetical protein JSS89_11920 [Bacteroidetes bacterium]|nr:hypothetical protein [Bacteroidota bacterium]